MLRRLLRHNGVNDSAPLDEVRFVSLDLETSGLNPKRNGILSIGAVEVARGEVKLSNYFYALVKPEGEFDERSALIHGLRPAELLDKPSFNEVYPKLAGFLKGAVLVGYNISFDVAFINEMLRKHGKPHLRLEHLDVLSLSYGVLLKAGMDTAVLKMDYRILTGRMGLEYLAELLSTPVIRRHTSLGDALTVALMLLKLLSLAKLLGAKTLRDLKDLARLGERRAKQISSLTVLSGGF
ncbi:MAG: hypothetical protein DRJ97_05610 [Thermoprotei archaeon]|nr:MAG: hypothetical protein DRJ97_05610 [Thermoprotei archaeon]